jgi:predicted aminopeptidase
LIGAAPYKGFFDRDRADEEARELREAGYEVCLSPVRAYSTLGWFDDPLTEPMLRLPLGRLTEVILHELVHATVFTPGDADFNEGLATFVGQEAAVRYREAAGDGARARSEVRDGRALSRLLADFRAELRGLYEDVPPGASRTERRAALEAELRATIAALENPVLDTKRYAREVDLSNACLALAGTYEEDIPRYATLLETLGGDLGALLQAANAAAEKPDPRAHLFPEAGLTP